MLLSLGTLWFTSWPYGWKKTPCCLKATFWWSSSNPVITEWAVELLREVLPTWACIWPLDLPSALSRSTWDWEAFSTSHFMSLYNLSVNSSLGISYSPLPQDQNFFLFLFCFQSCLEFLGILNLCEWHLLQVLENSHPVCLQVLPLFSSFSSLTRTPTNDTPLFFCVS